MITFDPKCVADAKANGLHLIRLEIDGRHAKRASMSLAVQVGPKTAARIKRLFADLCRTEKRIR